MVYQKRFIINSTIGLAGMFDPAKHILKIEQAILDDTSYYFGLICAINDETKQLNFNKKLAIFIVTANHPKEVNKYLYALGQTSGIHNHSYLLYANIGIK